MEAVVLTPRDLDALLRQLVAGGHRVLGPTWGGGAVVIGELEGVADLPAGARTASAPGTYRVTAAGDEAYFAHAVGPESWKRALHPSREVLWRGRRVPSGFEETAVASPSPPLALFGVRPCDLAAIAALDSVLLGRDPGYGQARDGMVVVAVHCTTPAATCFCASLGTGPRAADGYDVALTELLAPHRFVAATGSARGAELLGLLGAPAAGPDDLAAADDLVRAAAGRMGRSLDPDGLADDLLAAAGDPAWEDIGARCLACGNCTMVCPTCFCSTTEDGTDLTGAEAERRRRWDSCFSPAFSYLHGGSVRTSIASRYRQWALHKLATWPTQFGTKGCVGCGRCITWCPVGIDITAEVSRIRRLHGARR